MYRKHQGEREEVPLPKGKGNDYKHVVTIGKKTYIFESQQEGKDFIFLIRIKHIAVEDALEHINKLRGEGYYGKKEEGGDASGDF